MGLTNVDYGIAVAGVVFLIIWLIFYIKGLKYAQIFEVIPESEFPLKEIYFLGYGMLETIHYQYKTGSDRKMKQQLEVLYGRKYVDYYLRVIRSQQLTLSFTVLVLSVIVYCVTRDVTSFVVFVFFAALAFYYFGDAVGKKIEKRSTQMLIDFSDVVSKLTLLTNAGMILKEAWKEVAYAGKSDIYKEMQVTVEEMDNGISEVDAYYNFGKRCIIPEIKKFSSTIIQGVSKGNSELVPMLKQQSTEVWNQRKQMVKQQGDAASNKLLIPMLVMFLGVLIMIMVPMFSSLG